MFDRCLPALLTLVVGTVCADTSGGPAPLPSAPLPHHPHDVIADVALSTNYPEDPRMFVASPGTMNLFMVSDDHGLTWKHSRTGIAGKLFSRIELAPDWHESGIAYVATEDRGVQVSTDFCKTWPRATFSQQHLKFLEAAPVGEDGTRVLFAATHHQAFRSDDGARNFTPLSVPLAGAKIGCVTVSPDYHTDGHVLIGMSDGRILLSADRGQSWKTRRLPRKVPVTAAAFSPQFARDRQLWIGTWGAGMLRSRDGGKSLEPSNEGLTDLEVNDIAIAESRPGLEIFLATRNDGVFRSSTAGKNWIRTDLRVEKTIQTDNHHTKVVVSPGWPEDRTVACCTYEGLYISRDGGATWRESNVNPTRIGRHVTTSPNFAEDGVVAGAGYGMHMMLSEDHGSSWSTRCGGVKANSVYSVSISPEFADDGIMMLGVWHGVRRTKDRGKTWQSIEIPPDPGETRKKVGYTTRSITFSPEFAKDRVVFAVSNWGVLYRSDDAGESWRMIRRVSSFTSSFGLSPEYPAKKTMFIGGAKGLWRSDDDGATVEQVLDGSVAGDTIQVAPDFAATGEIYCVDNLRGFMIGTDRGSQWQASNEGLEGFSPATIKLSPNFAKDGTIVLLASGGGIFHSNDRGRSWKRVSAPGSPVDQGFCMALSSQFDRDKTAFVGTFKGFYRTRDGGTSWESVTSHELYDDKRDPWRRHGDGWKFRHGAGLLNSSITVSKAAGDMISIPFEGRSFRLFGTKGPDFGIAEIWLDRQKQATVDMYAAKQQNQEILFEREVSPGHHTLTILVTGEKNEQSRNTWVGVDAIEVTFR